MVTASGYDRGPLQMWEVTWKSGHVEKFQGHEMSFPGGLGLFGGPPRSPQIVIAGEFDGHWRIVLRAMEDDIRTIRLVTNDERIPLDGAS